MREEPIVSVVMPCYNDGQYVRQAVSSCLAQNDSRVEVVIVDDGSDDGFTPHVLASLASPRVKILRTDHIGPALARNAAIERAEGRYILPLDADDWIDPSYAERAAAILDSRPEVGIVYCRATLFGEKNGAWNLPSYSLDMMLVDNCIFVTAMFRKTDWRAVGGFCGDFKHGLEDYDFWLSLIERGRQVYQFPHEWFHYRIKPSSRSTGLNGDIAHAADTYRLIYERHRAFFAAHMDAYCLSLRDALIQEKAKNGAAGAAASLGAEDPVGEYWQSVRRLKPDRARQVERLLAMKNGIKTAGNRPKVSIVIPVYNGANFLAQAIDSALAQTWRNTEVIVVNDGSDDQGETARIARGYGNRIRYIEKEQGGVASALNVGIENMTGEYFSWLSHDDWYLPEKIERQLRLIRRSGDARQLVCGGYYIVDVEDAPIGVFDPRRLYPKSRLKTPLFPVLHCAVNGCAMLVHRSHFDRVGRFNEALPTTQDYDLWFRMLRGQRLLYTRHIDVVSRAYDGQTSRRLRTEHEIECASLWRGIFDALTAQERIAMAGSEQAFYADMYNHFSKYTSYAEVAESLRLRCPEDDAAFSFRKAQGRGSRYETAWRLKILARRRR